MGFKIKYIYICDGKMQKNPKKPDATPVPGPKVDDYMWLFPEVHQGN